MHYITPSVPRSVEHDGSTWRSVASHYCDDVGMNTDHSIRLCYCYLRAHLSSKDLKLGASESVTVEYTQVYSHIHNGHTVSTHTHFTVLV